MSPYHGKVQRYITQTTPPIWSRVRVPVAQDLRRDPAVTHVILRSNCNTISPIFHIWCKLTTIAGSPTANERGKIIILFLYVCTWMIWKQVRSYFFSFEWFPQMALMNSCGSRGTYDRILPYEKLLFLMGGWQVFRTKIKPQITHLRTFMWSYATTTALLAVGVLNRWTRNVDTHNTLRILY